MSTCIICKQDDSVFSLDHKHLVKKQESEIECSNPLEEKIQNLSTVLKAKRSRMPTRLERNDDWMYIARCPGCNEEKLLRIDWPICTRCEVQDGRYNFEV